MSADPKDTSTPVSNTGNMTGSFSSCPIWCVVTSSRKQNPIIFARTTTTHIPERLKNTYLTKLVEDTVYSASHDGSLKQTPIDPDPEDYQVSSDNPENPDVLPEEEEEAPSQSVVIFKANDT